MLLLSWLCAFPALADLHNQGVNLSNFNDILATRGKDGATVVKDDSGNPVLRFANVARSFAVYDQSVIAPEVSMDFRITGKTTFGVLLRGEAMDAPCYMVFVDTRSTSEGKAILYLSKTAFSIDADPFKGKLQSKVFPYSAGEWCKFRIALSTNEEGNVDIEAVIHRLDDDQMLVQLAATDQTDPIRQGDQMAIRYFNDSIGDENTLDVRNVEFSGSAD